MEGPFFKLSGGVTQLNQVESEEIHNYLYEAVAIVENN